MISSSDQALVRDPRGHRWRRVKPAPLLRERLMPSGRSCVGRGDIFHVGVAHDPALLDSDDLGGL
jgi:hypothetical protein